MNATARFTGRHMATIMAAFFAVIVTVNVFMAHKAGSTFGGTVVDNSYVASQHFNRWLDEASAEKALGWSAETVLGADRRLSVTLTGPASRDASLTAVARHPLGRAPDRALDFARQADGRFVSLQPLPAGRWRLRLEVSAEGRLWRSEGDVR